MGVFKFVEKGFETFFHQYFKDYDTYKNAEGKGILERFMEVGFEYFDNDILPDIDNFMDTLDVDKTDEIFLNYIWEFLGEIPYAYGVLIKHIPFTEADLKEWKEEERPYPTVNPRDILRYAISLYKIRCTSKFYEVLGRLYNVEFNIEEVLKPKPPGGLTSSTVWDVTYDAARYDSVDYAYDSQADCMECTDLNVTITVKLEDYTKWNELNLWSQVQQVLVNILNKYLPVNVNQLTVENVTFNVTND